MALGGAADTMTERFCPELQLAWRLVSLNMRHMSDVSVDVATSANGGYPDPMGRTTRDVLSWPTIWSEIASATFTFSGVIFVSASEEFAGPSEDGDTFEGRYFRRYTESFLLRQCQAARPGAEDKLLHYRLVFQDESIDVVCTKPPDVTFRAAAHEPVA